MYRLDLDDPRLALPVPVYDLGAELPGDFATKRDLPAAQGEPGRAQFFAPDRPAPGLVPIAWSGAACASRRLIAGETATPPLFYAHPPGSAALPDNALALHELAHPDGRRAYTVDPALELPGFVRASAPLAFVWPNPIRIAFPIAAYREPLRADAGQDQCLPAAAAARAEVTLDAAGSSGDPEIAQYVWHLPPGAPCPLVRGARATVELPPGRHRIRLEVIGGTGGRDDDELVVEIGSSP